MTVQIEVLTPMPEGWGMCQTCEFIIAQADLAKSPLERSLDSFPPDWQEEFAKTSKLILELSTRFGNSVKIVLYDPRSLQGMVKAIRFGVRQYPAFIINQKAKLTGWNFEDLEKIIAAAGGVSSPRDNL